MAIPKEIRLLSYVIGLYGSFIYWGLLQEKLTSTKYICSNQATYEWDFAFALNFWMALGGFLVAFIIEFVINAPTPQVSIWRFWKAALTCCIASPVGYASLKYITFPMMILTKSSKPVPVMLIGILYYKRSFPWYKYVSVILVCGGICLFSSAKKSSSSSGISDQGMLLFGIFLVCVNLTLDGYTNNEQDAIFNEKATGLQMMKYTNIWQIGFILVYLLSLGAFYGPASELSKASDMLVACPEVRQDILLFCLCASVGQILIFSVMKEFGSLTWITISITRKLFTVLLSIFSYNHPVSLLQWFGVIGVFAGLSLESGMSYFAKESSQKVKKAE